MIICYSLEETLRWMDLERIDGLSSVGSLVELTAMLNLFSKKAKRLDFYKSGYF